MSSIISPYVRTARPRQWVKNLLVFAAPLAAGVVSQPDALRNTLAAFVGFCLVASATYYLNDIRDRDADRAHPTKKLRPVAAGEISVGAAYATAGILALFGLMMAFSVSNATGAILVAYGALTTAYTLDLKQRVVFDILAVAVGFLLRAIAGAVAVDVPLSRWFVVVVGFGALFVVTIKRSAEHKRDNGDQTRAVLGRYTDTYLRSVRTAALAICLLAYSLWAFEKSDEVTRTLPLYEISILIVTYAMLRYEYLAETTDAETPEEVVFSDGSLIVSGVAWLAILAVVSL